MGPEYSRNGTLGDTIAYSYEGMRGNEDWQFVRLQQLSPEPLPLKPNPRNSQ